METMKLYMDITVSTRRLNINANDQIQSETIQLAFGRLIQGPKGDKGDPGLKGDTGAQGPKGDRGEQGIKGDTGEQGIQGVKGDKGDTGPQGIQGAKGEQGIQGVKGDPGEPLTEAEKQQIAALANAYTDTQVADVYADISDNTLVVTVTQSGSTNLAYTFTADNFNKVLAAKSKGFLPIVRIIDNRSSTYKTIDLSGEYATHYNSTLQQIEIPDPNVARGFYLSGGTPSNRGCVSHNTLYLTSPNVYIRSDYYRGLLCFNQVKGAYKCCDIDDISEYEMSAMMSYHQLVGTNPSYLYKGTTLDRAGVRTLIPFRGYSAVKDIDASYMYYYCKSLVTIWHYGRITKADGMFNGCTALVNMYGFNGYERTSLSLIDGGSILDMFTGCTSLENTQISNLKKPISFRDSPNLSTGSILYLISNSAAVSAITITLHPDAYARAIADTAVQTALSDKPLVTLISA